MIIASRGAVRMPLPMRSTATIATTAPKLLATSRTPRVIAERPYPTTATHFGWSPLSAAQPPAIRTRALTPCMSPSTNPYASVERPSAVVR